MSSTDEILTIQIPQKTVELWEELGLDNEMRKEDVTELQNAIAKIVEDYHNQVKIKRDKTRKEIEDIQKAHKKTMIAFGISQDEIQNVVFEIHPINLLQQLASAKSAYDTFKASCAERIKMLENLIKKAVEHFNLLGIPESERDDYAVLGDEDFSRERLERLRLKVEDLEKDIEQKKAVKDEYIKEINGIQKELSAKLSSQEEACLNSPLVTPEVIEGCRQLLERLQVAKAHRLKEITELALKITHIWDTLNTPDSERKVLLNKYTTISDEVLEKCQQELRNLHAKLDEKLPVLIESHFNSLNDLYNTLHIPVEGRLIIDESCKTGPMAAEAFQKMDQEIVRLKELNLKLMPYIKIITQIEDIRSEYLEMTQNHDPKNYTSRDKNSAIQLMKEERARRRYKVSLPKLKQKIIVMLQKYKKENGSDLEWDGRPYIDKLNEDEQQENIEKRMGGKITDCGSVPPVKRKAAKGEALYNNENAPDNRGNSARVSRRNVV